MRFKAVTLGFVLAGTTLACAALNLGRARGAAWIGQPLELVVPVQLDVGQAESALCAEADVFHGDTRIDSSRVQIQVLATDQPGTFNLKISSPTFVDEPVVTIYVRAGCAPKVSRKYVLLADFPSEPAVSAPSRIATPLAPPVPTLSAPEALQAAPANPSPGTATAATPKIATPQAKAAKPTPAPKEKNLEATKATASAPEAPTPKPSSAKAAKPAETAKAPASGKPHLRLDPVETLAERVKSLESATASTTLQEDAVRDMQKMQQLQFELRSLLDQAVKNEATLAALRNRLEKAEADRVPAALVYGLLTLLALCAGALAYLWSKRSQQPAWAQPAEVVTELHADFKSSTAPDKSSQGQTSPSDAFNANDVDVDLTDIDMDTLHTALDAYMPAADSSLPQATTTALRIEPSPGCDFSPKSQVSRRRQASSLATQGMIDEAIGLLEEGIRANPKESPLLFLDLLEIANTYSRKTDFRQFREEFNRLFNASVPDFALFRNEGRTLDAYPALQARINSQWESPQVLQVIENAILRTPESPGTELLDIAAFRALLTLHGAASNHHAAHAVG